MPSPRSIGPAPSTPSIRFDGDWTPTARHLVENAIADAEGLHGPASTTPDHGPGRSWLCYCKRLSGMTVYMAHRAGWQRVLYAYGPQALGLRILLFSQEAYDGAGGFTA